MVMNVSRPKLDSSRAIACMVVGGGSQQPCHPNAWYDGVAGRRAPRRGGVVLY
jgi:hypothetical protein